MRYSQWPAVTALLGILVVGGCQSDDNMGGVDGGGEGEGAVPAGAIPAPTEASTPAAAGAPLDSTPAATDTTTAVVGQ